VAITALNPKITNAALALAPNGGGTGFAFRLTHIAIGTGLYNPTGAEIALKSEVARYPIGGGSKPTPTSIQTGVTITDTDPQGRSPNGLAIGEIGWFGVPESNLAATPTLCAIWSRATGGALFVKSANFPVPFAYTMDISAFPQGSVNVTVGVDPQGMATLILQHAADPDPHTQYVQKARGMGEYDAKATYAIGAKVTGPDNKTYRSIVNNNTGNLPASNPTKWERWGHSVAEMDAEFVPKRTAVQMGAADTTGVVRISNPAGGTLGLNGAPTGALRIVFPNGSQAKDTFFRLRVDVLDTGDKRPFSAIISGHVNTSLAWETCEVAILGQVPDNDLPVRFGNDGTKPCILIGDVTKTWAYPRFALSEVMISLNGDGGDPAFWASGWAMSLVTSLGAVTITRAVGANASNLVFGQTDINHVAGLADILATKQGGLGYTPVQQGGGIGQGTNKVYLGWGSDGSGLKATVDATDLGSVALTNSPLFTGNPRTVTPAYSAIGLEMVNAQWVTQAIRVAQVGMVVFEPRTNPRAGYLLCNGAELSRTAYPDLWAAVQGGGLIFQDSDWKANYWGGFSYGSGGVNGTTFRIPELRGEFLRCHDFGRGRDSGRPYPGHFQGGQNASHAHGGAIAAVGDHLHSAWTDAQGYHAHTGSTYGAGSHNHNNGGYSRLLRPPYGGSLTGNDTSGSGSEQAVGPGDSADIVGVGDHAHSLAIDANGNHGHNVGIGSAGAHSHGLTIYADGGNEPRPHNVSIAAFIRVI
jgi:hypothetical protein